MNATSLTLIVLRPILVTVFRQLAKSQEHNLSLFMTNFREYFVKKIPTFAHRFVCFGIGHRARVVFCFCHATGIIYMNLISLNWMIECRFFRVLSLQFILLSVVVSSFLNELSLWSFAQCSHWSSGSGTTESSKSARRSRFHSIIFTGIRLKVCD